jgi:predicted RNase H-like HicB family nuclease
LHGTIYPVEYAGETKEEVIQNYPRYLETFIEERLNNNLNPLTEKETIVHFI